MNFIVIIQICSAVFMECGNPTAIYPPYNTWNNCIQSGYEHSLNVVKDLGKEEINKNKIMITFKCEELTSS